MRIGQWTLRARGHIHLGHLRCLARMLRSPRPTRPGTLDEMPRGYIDLSVHSQARQYWADSGWLTTDTRHRVRVDLDGGKSSRHSQYCHAKHVTARS
jgi:hypothetical protein